MKKRVKLTEENLHRIIRDCINEALNELDPRTYASYSAKRQAQGQDEKAQQGRQAAVKAWNKKFAENGAYGTPTMHMNDDYTVDRRTHGRDIQGNGVGYEYINNYTYDPYNDSVSGPYEFKFDDGRHIQGIYNNGSNYSSATGRRETDSAYRMARHMTDPMPERYYEKGKGWADRYIY